MPDGQRETRSRNGKDRVAINRNQFATQFSEVNPEIGRGGAVNDAQPEASALFCLDDFWVLHGAVIGEHGVKGDIARHAGTCHSIHGHSFHRAGGGSAVPGMTAGCHVRVLPRMAGMQPATAMQFGKNFSGVTEGEVMEHHHMFLLVDECIPRLLDDERRGEELLFLQAEMRVHPVCASPPVLEKIIGLLACIEFGRRKARNPVKLRRRGKAMPMDQCRLSECIVHANRKGFAVARHKPTQAAIDLKPQHLGSLAIDFEHAASRGYLPDLCRPHVARKGCSGKASATKCKKGPSCRVVDQDQTSIAVALSITTDVARSMAGQGRNCRSLVASGKWPPRKFESN